MNDILTQDTEKQFGPVPDKAKWAIASLLASMPFLTRKFILRTPINPMLDIPLAVASAAFGYSAPSLFNRYMEQKKTNPASAAAFLEDVEKQQMDKMREAVMADPIKGPIDEIVAQFRSKDPTQKTASLAGTANIFLKGGKGALNLGYDIARGVVAPLKGKTTRATALSIGSKAILGAGLYGTGKYIAKKARPPNYVTSLRNNILAGRLKPGELAPEDLAAVQKMGF
jgi:hypothetical protein